jgi:hypothetical protein
MTAASFTRCRRIFAEFKAFTVVQFMSLFFCDVVLHHWVIGA